jgi:benzoyl-CoA reductase/2-hydroxyglutaryl-CoA dehydratase subunit BcrC/BadD/HgdB
MNGSVKIQETRLRDIIIPKNMVLNRMSNIFSLTGIDPSGLNGIEKSKFG